MRWTGNVARMGGEEKRMKGFCGKTERKIPLWRYKWKLENDIKMNLTSDGMARTGFLWISIETSGRLF